MATTALSTIGGVILGSERDEIIVPALGDGSAKAGNLVGILDANSRVVACGAAATDDEFIGILLPNYAYDMDTAIAAGQPCSIVIPQSGHLYGVATSDMGTVKGGEVMTHSATDGELTTATNIEDFHVARLYQGADDDRFCVVIWGV